MRACGKKARDRGALARGRGSNRKKHAKTSEGDHVKLEERTRALACRPNARRHPLVEKLCAAVTRARSFKRT